MKNRIGTYLVGAAGEYYVCAEICRIGHHAILSQKNNPVFDIVAVNDDGNRSVAIQVKTRSENNNQGWKISAGFALEKHDELFVVLVQMKEKGGCDFYVCKHLAVAEKINQVYRNFMEKPKKDGSTRKEVGFRWINDSDIEHDESWNSMKNNWKPIIDVLSG